MATFKVVLILVVLMALSYAKDQKDPAKKDMDISETKGRRYYAGYGGYGQGYGGYGQGYGGYGQGYGGYGQGYGGYGGYNKGYGGYGYYPVYANSYGYGYNDYY